MNDLAIDIGGTHIKSSCQKRSKVVKVDPGSETPPDIVRVVLESAADWNFDHVSIGYPGPVVHNLPLLEPRSLGKGWVRFRYPKHFKQTIAPDQRCRDAGVGLLSRRAHVISWARHRSGFGPGG